MTGWSVSEPPLPPQIAHHAPPVTVDTRRRLGAALAPRWRRLRLLAGGGSPTIPVPLQALQACQ